MTYNIWQLSVILSFISTVVPGKAKIVQFNGPVKLFVDKDSKSNFTTNVCYTLIPSFYRTCRHNHVFYKFMTTITLCFS
uniref:Secreted protein n=1 Tax=Parascaris equorum TaxID=6256 RepID=A0A914RDK9_PAREQ